MLAGSPPDEPGTRALVHIKSNLGSLGHSFGYTISDEGFAWTGESSILAADLLAAPVGLRDHKLDDTCQWLTSLLKTGERSAKEVCELAKAIHISHATLRRAQQALKIRPHKVGMSGPWMWSLPEGAHDSPEDAQENSVSTFAGFEHLRRGVVDGARLLVVNIRRFYCDR
jgi:hypothetical protein